MKLLTLDECRAVLAAKYGDRARMYPGHFAALIPRPAPAEQLSQVRDLVTYLTGLECPQGLAHLLQVWDLDCLEVAGFSFGTSGSFPERLFQWNQRVGGNAWWEDAFDERPSSLLRVAQGDPYLLLVDVRTDHVLAYEAGSGAKTSVKVARDLPSCLRALVTLQVNANAAGERDVHDVAVDQGADCDVGFWEGQWRRWLPA